MLCCVSRAHALDSDKTISQYVHDRWGAERGFLGGTIFAICQSQDGYLWIGTERGLVRFDGFEFSLIQYPISRTAPIGAIRGLASDVYGNMWVRLDGPHLLLYRNGSFEDAMVRFGLQEVAFTAMSVDREGKLLLWGPQTRLLRFRDGAFRQDAGTDDIPGIVISTAQTDDGRLWMGTREIGLFEVEKERSVKVPTRLASTSFNTLLPAHHDGLWLGTDAGLELRDGSGSAQTGLLPLLKQLQILALSKDREGNVWVGTNHGLIRITPGLAVSTELIDMKLNNEVTTIYEDRDGDIWYGGSDGIERLRDGMFTGYSSGQGFPSANNGPVYVDGEGRTWLAPSSGGLYWFRDKHIVHVTIAGLDHDVIYSISGGGGEVWLGRQRGGLTELTSKADSFIARNYTKADGLIENSIYSVHRNRDGTVWAGSVSAGVSRLSKGVFTNYTVGSGLASNAIFSIVEGYNGTMWFATSSGVESLAQGQWKNFTVSDLLPSSTVRSIFEDAEHVLWIATSGGIALIASGRAEVPYALTDSLREEIFGIAEDQEGSLWIVSSDHVLQVPRERLLAGSLREQDVQSYGTEDGLPGVEAVRRDRSVVADDRGRIWISLAQGLGMADPEQAARHAVPVRVRIESLSTGAGQIALTDSPKFAAGTRSITFHYTESNLAVPQRVRFRYKLEGSDQDWSEDVAIREVDYKNLVPGPYQFCIRASNGGGLWNGPEATFRFLVEPHLWQTWWFRLICASVFVLIVVLLYQLRTFHLAKRLNVRFQDRLEERTRIAQDLHDTLLQGVLSASLQLDLVEEQTPHDSPTKPMLKRVLQLMGQVTEEGRSALRGLRVPANHSLSLETALSHVREEFSYDEKASYRVVAQGAARPIRRIVRDEAYRIGREAVVNAFLHASASNIEVEVEYASRFIRVIVRDDGCGMDPRVLDTGRDGHWGLPGMRERSDSIGASLKLRSRIGAGTEVELIIPGAISFEGQPRGPLFHWRSWLTRESFDRHGGGIKKRDDQ